MLNKILLLALLNAGLLTEASVLPRQNSRNGRNRNDIDNGNDNDEGNNDIQDSQLCLLPEVVQANSASTGQDPENPAEGQAASAT